ncbi:hypothetical protein KCU81_g38, partial [Aureobasidium melanogenum]
MRQYMAQTREIIPKRALAVVKTLSLANDPFAASFDTLALYRPELGLEPFIDFVNSLYELLHTRMIDLALCSLCVRGLDETAYRQMSRGHDISTRNLDASGGTQGVEIATQMVICCLVALSRDLNVRRLAVS